MKAIGKLVIGGAVLLLCVAPAHAALIDFEAYANFQNLNGVNLGGVTLTAPQGNVVVWADGSGAGYHSPVNAIANFLPGGVAQDNPLTGVFDYPTPFVSLWGGDGGGDSESWELRAFDSSSNLLGVANSGTWIGSPYRQLRIDAPGIASFEAYHMGSEFGILYDDLEFAPIPEPSTLAIWSLLALCGIGIGWRRRRKA